MTDSGTSSMSKPFVFSDTHMAFSYNAKSMMMKI